MYFRYRYRLSFPDPKRSVEQAKNDDNIDMTNIFRLRKREKEREEELGNIFRLKKSGKNRRGNDPLGTIFRM